MDLGIQGKVAFVSGGSKGIGRAVAEQLASEGCKVAVVARDKTVIESTVAALKADGADAIGISADLTKRDDIVRAVETVRQAYGPPDIVLTNVRGPGPGDFFDCTGEDFMKAFHDQVVTTVYLARECVPAMKAQGWGRIVMVGSNAPKEPPAELKHILANTARAALVTLGKSMANEFAGHGITVNTLGTGWIATENMLGYVDHLARESGRTRDEVLAEVGRAIPVGRPGKPKEMATLAAYLCSVHAAYLTGILFPVDGGVHRSAW